MASMAYSLNSISRTGLDVGQWIQFATKENLSSEPKKIQKFYSENQRFLVISREDATSDLCRCYFVDLKKSLYEYSGEMFSLGGIPLISKSEIRAVSKDSVVSLHGIEKVQAVYQMATQYLNNELAPQFKNHPVHKLGQTSSFIKNQRRLSEVLRGINLDELKALEVAEDDTQLNDDGIC